MVRRRRGRQCEDDEIRRTQKTVEPARIEPLVDIGYLDRTCRRCGYPHADASSEPSNGGANAAQPSNADGAFAYDTQFKRLPLMCRLIMYHVRYTLRNGEDIAYSVLSHTLAERPSKPAYAHTRGDIRNNSICPGPENVYPFEFRCMV